MAYVWFDEKGVEGVGTYHVLRIRTLGELKDMLVVP